MTLQSALHIFGFYIHRFNQLQIQNILKKIQRLPKSKTGVCYMLATIYIVYMFYLQLFTQYICFIYNYLHSIYVLFTTIYIVYMFYLQLFTQYICFIYNYLHSTYTVFWASLGAQSVLKNPPPNTRDVGLIPGLGKSPGEGNSNLFQYSCLGNPMDREAWQVTVHGVTKELDMTQ